jgi:hypothetical protein
LGLTSLSEAE